MATSPKDNNREPILRRGALYTTAGVIILLIALAFFRPIVQTLLIIFLGILLAVLLDSLAKHASKRLRLKRGIALGLAVLVILAVVGIIGYILGPAIVSQVDRLLERIPETLESIRADLSDHEWGRELAEQVPSIEEMVPFGREIVGGFSGLFTMSLQIATGLLIVLFIGLYGAAEPQLYIQNLSALVAKEHQPLANEILTSVGRALRWWLLGRTISMIIIGLLVWLGLWAIGVPLAGALGLIAAVMSFVPYIGPIIAGIPALLIAAGESSELVLYTLIVYILVQVLEGYLITPMVQKRAVFVPPALLLSMQILMGVLFGSIGILLATPLLVVIIVVIQIAYVKHYLHNPVKIMGDH